MKRRALLILGFLVLLSVPLFALVSDANAATCNGVETTVDFQCDKYNTDGVSAILMYVINFMAIGVGIAVVIGIIFGGITYAMSDGEESKAKEGREIISNSIIGLFLFIFLYAGANFLIPGGAFNLNAKPAAAPTSSSPPAAGGTTPDTPSNFAKVYNFRDTASSGVIKSGILFRSANLDSADTADKNELIKLLNGGVIIDLRQSGEGKADPSLTNVNRKSFPMSGSYSDFVNDKTTRNQLGNEIRYIANSNGPVLVHCKYGKDRTGWTIAMIMYALGASDSQVTAEYLKSNDNPLPGSKTATAKTLTDAVKAAKTKYGSVDKYLTKGLGLTSTDIATLKSKLGA